MQVFQFSAPIKTADDDGNGNAALDASQVLRRWLAFTGSPLPPDLLLDSRNNLASGGTLSGSTWSDWFWELLDVCGVILVLMCVCLLCIFLVRKAPAWIAELSQMRESQKKAKRKAKESMATNAKPMGSESHKAGTTTVQKEEVKPREAATRTSTASQERSQPVPPQSKPEPSKTKGDEEKKKIKGEELQQQQKGTEKPNATVDNNNNNASSSLDELLNSAIREDTEADELMEDALEEIERTHHSSPCSSGVPSGPKTNGTSSSNVKSGGGGGVSGKDSAEKTTTAATSSGTEKTTSDTVKQGKKEGKPTEAKATSETKTAPPPPQAKREESKDLLDAALDEFLEEEDILESCLLEVEYKEGAAAAEAKKSEEKGPQQGKKTEEKGASSGKNNHKTKGHQSLLDDIDEDSSSDEDNERKKGRGEMQKLQFPEHGDESDERLQRMASPEICKELKFSGDQCFKKGEFQKALTFYHKAQSCLPEAGIQWTAADLQRYHDFSSSKERQPYVQRTMLGAMAKCFAGSKEYRLATQMIDAARRIDEEDKDVIEAQRMCQNR